MLLIVRLKTLARCSKMSRTSSTSCRLRIEYIVRADANAKDRVASAELISEELEIPVGTVRVYRNRAMATIRRELRMKGYQVP